MNQVTKHSAVECGTVETLTTETRGWDEKDGENQSSDGGEKLHDGILGPVEDERQSISAMRGAAVKVIIEDMQWRTE